MITNTSLTSIKDFQSPNGVRYAPSGVLVGETRQRRFAGTQFKAMQTA
jgi:hypothetical protein